MKTYDLIVIGAGSGGLVVATTANRAGMKVAMLEKHKIGGECTHSGCVPSKALINSAKAFHSLQHTAKLGLPAVDISNKLNFSEVMEHVDGIVQGIYAHETPDVWEKQGIDVYVHSDGAKFIDAETVKIGPDVLHAPNTIICTGSSPRLLSLPGSEHISFLHNENFWDIRELPESILFIGGGVISAEIGQALARFGSKVSILDRNARILKVVDDTVADYLIPILEQEGIQMIGNANPIEFKQTENKIITLIEQDGKQLEIITDQVFLATGRVPNLAGMDLEKAGINYTSRGVSCNEYLQTSAPNIYVCGDVSTPAKFTHNAAQQATICVDNIRNGNQVKDDLSILPWAIFTEPEIAHVGMSEKDAIGSYGADKIQVFKVDAAIDRFITDSKTGGFLKVIFGPDDQVLGADAIGVHAGEWTQMITLVMKNKIPVESFVYTIFSYPTYSEIVKKVFTRYLRTKSS